MIDQELLKYGVAGIAIWAVVKIGSKAFDFAAKRTSETGRLRAGDVPPEYFDKRFDKIDAVLAGMVDIMKQLTGISGDMRDMLRDERARHYEGD